LHADFVLAAFAMAVTHRGGSIPRHLLVHSDRGVQYASERFRAALAHHHARPSMSRRGNCYDNARAEAFFSTLKLEFIYRHHFATRARVVRPSNGSKRPTITAVVTARSAISPQLTLRTN
jgi:transposase InsO family protein